MSIVKDPALAPSGRRKISWVRDFMPALGGIEARFQREKPFAGLRVAVSVHLEAKPPIWAMCSPRGALRCGSPAPIPSPPRTT